MITPVALERSNHHAATTTATRRHLPRLGLIGAILAIALLSLMTGDAPVSLGDALRAFVTTDPSGGAFIVQSLRLPRVVVAILAGLAFGVAGLLLQVLARNPLASPDVIGINAGAGVGAVAVTVTSFAAWADVTVAALAGATLAATALYLLAWKDGVTGERMVLMGIAVAAAGSSGILYLTTQAKAFDAQRAVAWLAGSLNARSWDDVSAVAVPCLLLLPVAVALRGHLRVLSLGDEVARVLGIGVERTRLTLYATSVALCAGAVAAAGPVAFVALMSPHIARRMRRDVVPLFESALCGALLMVAADLIGRRLFSPIEIPVGVVTGVAGAPLLLLLLSRARSQ